MFVSSPQILKVKVTGRTDVEVRRQKKVTREKRFERKGLWMEMMFQDNLLKITPIPHKQT